MATVVGPSFRVAGIEPPGYAGLSQAERLVWWEGVKKLVLKAKDDELKAGLDRYGNRMADLAPSTIANRRSAMGEADPGAPPLQPAHDRSRTRALLTAKATPSGVVCWWLVDVHTRASWGEILKHHRAGLGPLPKRDVIGLSLASKAEVKARALAWWAKRQAKKAAAGWDFKVGTAAQVADAKASGKFSGWHTEAQVDAKLKAQGITYDEGGGGIDFKAFWAKKKPPPPSSFPSAPRRDPKPPTPPEPIGRHLPSDEAMAKPWSSPFAPKPKKPKPDPWPKDLAGLVELKPLGGSTGAKLVEDPKTGRKYVLKRGNNPGHLKSEAAADALYRAAGLDVPDSRIFDGPQGPTKLAAYHEGTTLGELMRTDADAFARAVEKLREGFAADALYGNWDVIGADLDNVLVTAAGKVLRIDNGGALAYRAQGKTKASSQWSAAAATVEELATMRSPKANRSAGLIFGPLSDEDVKAQVKALVKRRAKILAAAPDPATRAVLEGRLAAMEAWAKPAPKVKHADGWTPTPAEEFRQLADGRGRREWIEKHYGDGPTSKWWTSLTGDQQTAVFDYTGSGYHDYNDWHRGKAKAKPYKIDERTANLDAALAKTPVPEGVVLYRGVSNPTPVYKALKASGRDGLKVGMDIMDVSYTSASPNPRKAWGGLKLEIRVPKGAHGAYLGENSVHSNEEEFLLGRDRDVLRIVEINEDWIVVEALNSQDLAAKAAKKKGGKP